MKKLHNFVLSESPDCVLQSGLFYVKALHLVETGRKAPKIMEKDTEKSA